MLHCHLEFHAEIGMALIIQVGEKSEMKPVPSNFPKCGNYMPEPLIDENNNIRDDDINKDSSGSHMEVTIIPALIILITYLTVY